MSNCPVVFNGIYEEQMDFHDQEIVVPERSAEVQKASALLRAFARAAREDARNKQRRHHSKSPNPASDKPLLLTDRSGPTGPSAPSAPSSPQPRPIAEGVTVLSAAEQAMMTLRLFKVLCHKHRKLKAARARLAELEEARRHSGSLGAPAESQLAQVHQAMQELLTTIRMSVQKSEGGLFATQTLHRVSTMLNDSALVMKPPRFRPLRTATDFHGSASDLLVRAPPIRAPPTRVNDRLAAVAVDGDTGLACQPARYVAPTTFGSAPRLRSSPALEDSATQTPHTTEPLTLSPASHTASQPRSTPIRSSISLQQSPQPIDPSYPYPAVPQRAIRLPASPKDVSPPYSAKGQWTGGAIDGRNLQEATPLTRAELSSLSAYEQAIMADSLNSGKLGGPQAANSAQGLLAQKDVYNNVGAAALDVYNNVGAAALDVYNNVGAAALALGNQPFLFSYLNEPLIPASLAESLATVDLMGMEENAGIVKDIRDLRHFIETLKEDIGLGSSRYIVDQFTQTSPSNRQPKSAECSGPRESRRKEHVILSPAASTSAQSHHSPSRRKPRSQSRRRREKQSPPATRQAQSNRGDRDERGDRGRDRERDDRDRDRDERDDWNDGRVRRVRPADTWDRQFVVRRDAVEFHRARSLQGLPEKRDADRSPVRRRLAGRLPELSSRVEPLTSPSLRAPPMEWAPTGRIRRNSSASAKGLPVSEPQKPHRPPRPRMSVLETQPWSSGAETLLLRTSQSRENFGSSPAEAGQSADCLYSRDGQHSPYAGQQSQYTGHQSAYNGQQSQYTGQQVPYTGQQVPYTRHDLAYYANDEEALSSPTYAGRSFDDRLSGSPASRLGHRPDHHPDSQHGDRRGNSMMDHQIFAEQVAHQIRLHTNSSVSVSPAEAAEECSPSEIGPAGTYQSPAERRGPAETDQRPLTDHLSEHLEEPVSDPMSDPMSDQMSDRLTDRLTEHTTDRLSQHMPDRLSQHMPDRLSQRLLSEGEMEGSIESEDAGYTRNQY